MVCWSGQADLRGFEALLALATASALSHPNRYGLSLAFSGAVPGVLPAISPFAVVTLPTAAIFVAISATFWRLSCFVAAVQGGHFPFL